jgi:hypothetical protein
MFLIAGWQHRLNGQRERVSVLFHDGLPC